MLAKPGETYLFIANIKNLTTTEYLKIKAFEIKANKKLKKLLGDKI